MTDLKCPECSHILDFDNDHLTMCLTMHNNASSCIRCPNCSHYIADGLQWYKTKNKPSEIPKIPELICQMCDQTVEIDYRTNYLENHLMSFEEHFMECDECSLTWAEDWCDEFKEFLRWMGKTPVAQLETISNGQYVKIEMNGIHLGVAHRDFTHGGQEYLNKTLPLLMKYGVELVWSGWVSWTPETGWQEIDE